MLGRQTSRRNNCCSTKHTMQTNYRRKLTPCIHGTQEDNRSYRAIALPFRCASRGKQGSCPPYLEYTPRTKYARGGEGRVDRPHFPRIQDHVRPSTRRNKTKRNTPGGPSRRLTRRATVRTPQPSRHPPPLRRSLVGFGHRRRRPRRPRPGAYPPARRWRKRRRRQCRGGLACPSLPRARPLSALPRWRHSRSQRSRGRRLFHRTTPSPASP